MCSRNLAAICFEYFLVVEILGSVLQAQLTRSSAIIDGE
jgi:hypothetical protein